MNELIAKIVGGAVAVESNINKYLQTQGVIVRVSVGGGRNSYYISPKIYGIVQDKLSEDSNEFLGQHVKDGRISLLPKEDEKRFRAIESRVKKKLRETAIGYGDSFVPMTSFPEFKEYFEKNRDEFFEIRDSIVARYDVMKHRFAEIARNTLKELGAVDGEKELEDILKRLPSKEGFAQSFRMDMMVTAFPTTENLDMFDEDIRKEILGGTKQDESNLILESVVATINEGFTVLSSVIRSVAESGKLHSRVILGVKNGVKRMGQKNIAGNEKMDSMRAEIESILTKDSDDAAGACEFLISEIYKYAKEIGVDDRIDLQGCPFTVGELEDLIIAYS